MATTCGDKKTRSNYDRWKPGVKLACMIALKKVGSDPNYFDVATNKFSSLTWHTVAENLNKEYPDYAKKFTNINVKDRYDRVMKHHKVFSRMAIQLSGFVWNPKTFCFEQNENLIKQYQDNEIEDEIIQSDINIARFLCKSGHVDLEYYHRYIHQISNEEELRNDSVFNSPSFIENVISKGILTNISTRSDFFKDGQSSNTSGTSSLNSSGSLSAGRNLYSKHNMTEISPSTLKQLPGPSNNFQRPFQAPLLQQTLHQHQQQFNHLNQVLPPHHGPNAMAMPLMQQPNTNSIHPSNNNELDFSGLIDNQSTLLNSQHLSQLTVIPTISPPDRFNNTKLDGSSPDSTHPARKRLKPTVPPSITQPGLLVEFYYGSNQPDQHSPQKGLTSGEAVLQIYQEFEAMKAVVGEEIVQLRAQKIISFADFQALQDIQENSVSFIRAAYKRIVDNEKILDIINIFLNKG